MFNIHYIDGNADTYERLIKKGPKRDTYQKGKADLFIHYDDIIAQLNTYKNIAPRFESLVALSNSIQNYTSKNLSEPLYNLYDTNQQLKDQIKSIMISNPLTKEGLTCPYCGISRNEGRDLDHYIPRENFPEFSILSNNLIYCCSTCNQPPNKGTSFLDAHGNRTVLNPYYDADITITPILECEIDINMKELYISYKVLDSLQTRNPYLYTIACNHMSTLHLNQRYARLARNDLVTKFINFFINRKEKKRRIMLKISTQEAHNYIQSKILELGTINYDYSINNFEYLFWEKLKTCTRWFTNISNQPLD